MQVLVSETTAGLLMGLVLTTDAIAVGLILMAGLPSGTQSVAIFMALLSTAVTGGGDAGQQAPDCGCGFLGATALFVGAIALSHGVRLGLGVPLEIAIADGWFLSPLRDGFSIENAEGNFFQPDPSADPNSTQRIAGRHRAAGAAGADV